MPNIKLNRKQRKWLREYEETTMFEPLHLDELLAGEMTFDEIARRNINWYEAHMRDAYNAISNNVPWSNSQR
jgi:hypothetical protein